uniref:Uncharacterized protein n=1 Tax=viral metagenome TaxID=1070528 RepID=A0A6M3IJI5_9ZZZZ
MKRLLLVCLLLVLISGTVYAWNDGSFSSGLMSTGYIDGGATSMATGITAIPLNYSIVKKTVTNAGSESLTLADGIQGQVIKIIQVDNPGTITITPTTTTGFASVVLNAVGDQVTLLFIDNDNGWIIVGETGSTVNQ